MSTPSDQKRPQVQQSTLFELPDDPPPCPPTQAAIGRPRLRTVNREQIVFRAAPLDELLPQDHPARIVWDYVEGLDLGPLLRRIKSVEGRPGRAPIDPKILLALWLYATIEGIGSARELDRLCREHDAFRWIAGDVSINYHTLSDFRTDHVELLDDLLTQSVAAMMAEGLVDLNRVAQDGMRVRASAGAAAFRRRPTREEARAQAQEQVDALRDEVEEDPAATDRRHKAAQQRAARERAERVQAALGRLPELEAKKKPDQKDRARCSTTDADATVMKMADGGFRPAYNFQFATDTATQVIAGVAVETSGSDAGQLTPMVDQVEERSGKVPPRVVGRRWLRAARPDRGGRRPGCGLHGLRAGAQAQGPEGGPARTQAGRRRGGGGVADADGDRAGQGNLQGAGRDGRVCQRVGAGPGPGVRAGARRGQGESDRAVVCTGAQPAVRGAAACRGGGTGVRQGE